MTTILLCDANNVAMRAIHAMSRSGLSANGVATGPLLATINTLSKHVKEEGPDKVVVCWDGGRSTHRVSLDADYKAHRLAMEPDMEEHKDSVFALAKEFCTLAGIHHVERPGVEADDLIAHYVAHREPGSRTVILSSDKDFLQLLAADVEQVRLSSAGTPTDRWTVQRVEQEMRCHPVHLAKAMALAGDVSDNVPGVPRFGMKTAIKTLAKYDYDLEDALGADPRLDGYADRVRLNLRLVNLQDSVNGLDLPALPWFCPTAPGDAIFPLLVSFLTKHQMRSVQSRLYEQTLWK